MNEFQEKVRSLGFSTRRGSSETRQVTDERDGSVAGETTEHWDDRVDVRAIAKPVRLKARRR